MLEVKVIIGLSTLEPKEMVIFMNIVSIVSNIFYATSLAQVSGEPLQHQWSKISHYVLTFSLIPNYLTMIICISDHVIISVRV